MNEDDKEKKSDKPLSPDSKDIIALIIAALQVLAPYVLIMTLAIVGIMWLFNILFS